MEFLLPALIFLSIGFPCDARYMQTGTCRPENSNHCYYLYKSIFKLSWYEAERHCGSHGHSLVSIPDQATQDIIEHLLRSASLLGDVQLNSTGIWTGGKASTGATWWTLNLSAFQGYAHSGNEVSNFVAIRKITGGIEFVADEYRYLKYPLCQIHRPGGCVSEIAVGALCYKQLSERVTWYRALSLCEQYAPGATLAYTDVHTQKFTDIIVSLIDDYESWIGVFRRSWFWNKPDDFREEWIMRYYNWAPGSVSQGSISNPQCVVIRGDQGYKWISQSCDSVNPDYIYQYFICEEDWPVSGISKLLLIVFSVLTVIIIMLRRKLSRYTH